MPVTVLVGTQWGDEGKGRAVDVLSQDADMVVRCQGGTNAGHTVIAGDTILKLRLIPSSILRPAIPVIGDGVVIDPEVLLEEFDALTELRIPFDRLMVSGNAHLIMPYHRELDRVTDRFLGRNQISTTRKGIGPAYADKASRMGLRVQDLLDMKIFEQKLEANLREKNAILAKIYNRMPLDGAKILADYAGYAERLAPHIRETSLDIARAVREGKRVLLEGAQGTLLDIDRGTYPFVTSSSCTASGICAGAGIGPRDVDRVVGATKAHCTRVGTGPFPTELDGEIADRLRGVRGELDAEFGTVTGRSRRMGWLDAVALRFSARVNSLSDLFITKLDKLSGHEQVKIAIAYDYEGERYDNMPMHQTVLHKCTPVYETHEGWSEDISGARTFADLPRAAQAYVRRIEELADVPLSWISVGPERDQLIDARTVPVGV